MNLDLTNQTVTTYFGFAGGAVTMIIGAWSYYSLVRMANCRRPTAPYRPQHWMLIYRFPNDLTPEGRRYRRRYLVSSWVFLVCWIVWFAFIIAVNKGF
jgi:hypothetical protein